MEVFHVDFPIGGQPVGEPEHERARFGIDTRTVVLAAIGSRDEQDAEGPLGSAAETVGVVGFHFFSDTAFFASRVIQIVTMTVVSRLKSRDLFLQSAGLARAMIYIPLVYILR